MSAPARSGCRARPGSAGVTLMSCEVLQHRDLLGGDGRQVAGDDPARARSPPPLRTARSTRVAHVEVELHRLPVEIVAEPAAVGLDQHVARRRPARAAGPSGRRPPATTTPPWLFQFAHRARRPRRRGRSRRAAPSRCWMISSATRSARSIGMAKPSPTEPPLLLKIEELTPDHLAQRVGQRPARVAGVDGGVGLDHVEVEAGLLAGRAGCCGRWRSPRPTVTVGSALPEEVGVGVAQRDDPLADHEVGAVAQWSPSGRPCRGRPRSTAMSVSGSSPSTRGRQVGAVRQRHHDLGRRWPRRAGW